MAFDFYEINEKGANSAVVSFTEGVNELMGGYSCDNMLKRFAAYKRGVGNSMIENFKFIPATKYELGDKTVDLNKLENDYIRNGRRAEDLAEYLSKITQLKTQRFRMQVFPKTHIVESEPINRDDALTFGSGDVALGQAMIAGDENFIRPMLSSETHENNLTFIKALQDIKANGIAFKKTRWDGGVNGDGNDIIVPLPTYCQYTTINNNFISIEDLLLMRAQMSNNMTDAPELQRPITLVMSPNTAAQMVINNADKDNLLHTAVFGEKGTASTKLPEAYGFSFYQNPLCPDNEVFAVTNGVTLGVYDWGTTTRCKEDANIWEVSTIRRRPNYGVKVIQPLSYLSISIRGKTEEYDNNRIASLETTTDEPFKPIRKRAN